MKLSTVFVGALATLATAAPAKVEEEKRNIGGFGGGLDAGFDAGLDAFGVGAAAGFGGGLDNFVSAFGGGLVQGNVFNSGLLGGFNNFNVANANVAFLLGANNFDFNSLFTFFDLSLAVNPFANIFNFGAGNVLDLQTVLDINNALVFQWLLNQFGNQLFFQQSFLGFGGSVLPTLNFDILDGAGIGLGSQFAIDQSLLDINAFNSVGANFLTGGFDAFNAFDFVNLKNSGVFLKE